MEDPDTPPRGAQGIPMTLQGDGGFGLGGWPVVPGSHEVGEGQAGRARGSLKPLRNPSPQTREGARVPPLAGWPLGLSYLLFLDFGQKSSPSDPRSGWPGPQGRHLTGGTASAGSDAGTRADPEGRPSQTAGSTQAPDRRPASGSLTARRRRGSPQWRQVSWVTPKAPPPGPSRS